MGRDVFGVSARILAEELVVRTNSETDTLHPWRTAGWDTAISKALSTG
jgi:hypothetical protein